jgi:Flp pilus assembly protein TadG
VLIPGRGGSRRPSLWRANRGATAIETAILLPLLLAFLLGIEELGRLLWIQSILQYACEYTARWAALPGNSADAPPQVAAQAANYVFGLNSSNITFTYNSPTASPPTQTPCGGPDVQASYTFQSVVPLNQLLGLAGINALNGIVLTAQSCLPASTTAGG